MAKINHFIYLSIYLPTFSLACLLYPIHPANLNQLALIAKPVCLAGAKLCSSAIYNPPLISQSELVLLLQHWQHVRAHTEQSCTLHELRLAKYTVAAVLPRSGKKWVCSRMFNKHTVTPVKQCCQGTSVVITARNVKKKIKNLNKIK